MPIELHAIPRSDPRAHRTPFQAGAEILRRRWLPFVVVLALGISGAAFALSRTTPIYRSAVQLVLVPRHASDASDAEAGQLLTQQMVLSLVDLVQNAPVLEPVIRSLRLGVSTQTLGADIDATSPLNTVVINLTVDNSSQALATKIADAVALRFQAYVASLQSSTPGTAPVRAMVSEPAHPLGKVAPKRTEYLAIGAAVGAILGLALAAALEVSDDRIRTLDGLREAARVPVLAALPKTRRRVASAATPDAVRQLGYALRLPNKHPSVLALTSPTPTVGVGKTTIGLAMALASRGRKVLAIDADMSGSGFTKTISEPSLPGLCDVASGRLQPAEVVTPLADNDTVLVIPLGTPERSRPAGSVLAGLEECLNDRALAADVVLINAPPVLGGRDGTSVIILADAAVLLAPYGKARGGEVAAAAARLQQADANLVGAALIATPAIASAAVGNSFDSADPVDPPRAAPSRLSKK